MPAAEHAEGAARARCPTGGSQGSSEMSAQVTALLQQRHRELVRRMEVWLRMDEECVRDMLRAQACAGQDEEAARPPGVPAEEGEPRLGLATDGVQVECRAAEAKVAGKTGYFKSKWAMNAASRAARTSYAPAVGTRSSCSMPGIARTHVSLTPSFHGQGRHRLSTVRNRNSPKQLAQSTQDEQPADASASVKPDGRTWKGVLRGFVSSNVFTGLVFVIVLTNIMLVGVETDYFAGGNMPISKAGNQAFNDAQLIYTILFSAELMLRVLAEGCNFFCNDQWCTNYFEFLIVVLSVLDCILSTASMGGESLVSFGQNWVVRFARVVRILRTLRIVRVVGFIREVCMLIQSITSTLRSLVWAMILMMFIFYGFGIVFTQAVTDFVAEHEGTVDTSKLEKHWGTLPRSIFSLFQAVTSGISWIELVEPLNSIHWTWVALFLVFFVGTFFALLNVMTAVFCQNAIESANLDKEIASMQLMANKQHWVQEMKEVFHQIDANQSGEVDADEFEESLKNEKTRAFFAARGIDVYDAWTLFKLLDCNQRGVIELDTFIEGLLQLRGPAQAMQMARVLYDGRVLRRSIEHCMDMIELCFKQISDRTSVWDCGLRNHTTIGSHKSRSTSKREHAPPVLYEHEGVEQEAFNFSVNCSRTRQPSQKPA